MNAVSILLIVVAILSAAVVALLAERARRGRRDLALRAREEQQRSVLAQVPYMLWTAGPDGMLDYLNPKCSEFSGLSLEQLREFGWFEIVHPEHRAYCVKVLEDAAATQKAFVCEYRLRRADGEYRWLMGTGVPRHAADGTFTGFIGGDVDITERKNAEEHSYQVRVALEAGNREIRLLAGRLIEAQDAERARIARELHDDVSQQVAGLSIALSNLKRRMETLHAEDELKSDLQSIHQRSATMAQNIRHLSHDLHPTVLRHAGLVAALTAHCDELARLNAVALSCTAEGELESVAPEAALCLYRIGQEALRNVIAHAGAGRVTVRLVRDGDRAEITIEDDGCGFDVDRSLRHGKGLGLLSMRERVRIAGGTVTVEAAPTKGTRVHAWIPAVTKVEVDSGANGRHLEPSHT